MSAELITNFAVELSKYFKRVFIIGVAGNHSRLIANKDKDIKDERLDTLITWIIEQMTKIHQYGIMSSPTTSQYAAIEALRNCDEDVEYMYAEAFSTTGVGQAIMNRLLKAAGHQVVHV